MLKDILTYSKKPTNVDRGIMHFSLRHITVAARLGDTTLKNFTKRLLIFLILLGFLPAAFAAPEYWPAQKLIADKNSHLRYGFAVSISGDRMVVSAPGDAVYVFDYNGTEWVQTAELPPDDGLYSKNSDTSIAVSGNRIISGRQTDSNNAGEKTGSVYVFDFDGTQWVQTAKLLAADGRDDDYFGSSVSISGDLIVVGAYGNDNPRESAGAAYVFSYDGTNWVQIAKLQSPDGRQFDRFGKAVSISGNHIVVGELQDDDLGISSGSAYVFSYDGTNWLQTAKLLPNDGEMLDNFGLSVSINNNRIVVGSMDDALGYSSGSVYVFTFNGTNWVQTAKLLPDDRRGDGEADFLNFGASVYINGDSVVVGALGDDIFGLSSGSAYVFNHDGTDWVQIAKLVPADGADNDVFGSSVSIDGDWVVVSSPLDNNSAGLHAGSVYLFQKLDVVNPLPDIKVNGFDGPVNLINDTSEVIISGQIFAGETVGDVDYWLFADTPLGRYSYVHKTKSWEPGMHPTRQAPIRNVLEQAYNDSVTRLPVGTTVIQGGVDLTPNGVLDEPTFLDNLELNISEP